MEVFDVDSHLREWENDVKFCVMVGKMREKFNKYWGDFMNLNMYTYFALILDPYIKMQSVRNGIEILMSYDQKPEIMNDEFDCMVDDKKGLNEKAFGDLYAQYKAREGERSRIPSKKLVNEVAPSQSKAVNDFLFGREGGSYKVATELEKYLNEPREELHPGFDILLWWKLNGPRFPTLAKTTKDILAL
uniref:zinc finger BED domain-containing protein RICESLEEPER 2-like n=1 Tax=Erigeron canadensis TaxID=72917 RepID=UPI001CB8DAF1|nr:zinc finger BED domain-containing protein RICESLEEPER 2-like [Erigeron canadensis]